MSSTNSVLFKLLAAFLAFKQGPFPDWTCRDGFGYCLHVKQVKYQILGNAQVITLLETQKSRRERKRKRRVVGNQQKGQQKDYL